MKFLILALVFASTFPLNAATMAISVLVTTNDETKDWAAAVNRDILQKYPEGYKFDDSHLSHIPLHQSYVEISCFDEKWDAIEKEMKSSRVLGLKLVGKSFRTIPLSPGSEISELQATVASHERLMALQKKLQSILRPCRSEIENPKAFYGLLPKDPYILSAVKNFEQNQSGPEYTPMMSLGVAKTDDLGSVMKSHTIPAEFIVKRIGIFRLGAYGTARERLYSFD